MTCDFLGPSQCVLETDYSGFTLVYNDSQTRDLRGIDELTGTHVELSAQQVKGKFLSEVLAFVDAEVDILHQGFSGPDHIVTDTIAGDSCSATIQEITDTIAGDSCSATSQEITDGDDEDEEMADAPSPAAPVEPVQDVRRNPARTRKPTRKILEKI